MAASDVARLGLPCSDIAAPQYVADSGVTAISATPQTVVGTIAANFDASQPIVRQGWLMIEIAGMTGGATLGLITVTVDDGTNTVRVMTIPAAATLVANQGCNILLPIFVTLSDSLVTIKNVNVIIATATANTGNARVYFVGGP